MPKLDLDAIPARAASDYPTPLDRAVDGRSWQEIGDVAGLTRFGVNRVLMAPGAASSLRHWHPTEDEFAVMIAGELVLVEDEGETVLRPGDCVGWAAGVENGHHLVNRSDAEAVFIVVGSRPEGDCIYSDVDLAVRAGAYTRRDGSPL